MEQYIPKSALVAEIKRRKSEHLKRNNLCDDYYVQEDNAILSSINSLEGKEVELEEEIERVRKTHFINDDFEKATLEGRQITNIAKHFFELGLKSQNMITPLQQQRISVMKMEFWTGLQTFNESEMTLSDAYNKGIEDVLEELGLKTQKGE